MVLKLDPRIPLVWRSPVALQLGIDPALVRIDDVTATQERMIAALVAGVSESGLAMIAGGLRHEHDELLSWLEPALLDPVGGAEATVAVSGPEVLASAIAGVLSRSGVRTIVASAVTDLTSTEPDLAVVAGHFVLPPEAHAAWLRRDVPHLPVVLSDTGAVVGPVVEPGSSPCLLCLELHHRDEDAAWPAIATQLLGRHSAAESAILVAETAAAAARTVLERLAAGPGAAVSVRIDAATGGRRRREWLPHPECGCRGIPPLSAG